MNQDSLFDPDDAPSRIPTIGVAASTRTLSKTQKRFNQLVQRLGGQRAEIARWKMYRDAHQRRIAGEWQPLLQRYRARRIALVMRFDAALGSAGLGRRQHEKVRDILCGLLEDLLAEQEEPALVSLYDKHAPETFEEIRDEQLDVMRSVMSEAFGVDPHELDGVETREDVAAWMDEQLAARQQRADAGRRSQRPRGARAAADEAQRAQHEQAAEAETRSLRDVFRGLASRLHPDRETDAAERARKTELMKEVNQAYKAGDLLRLLELQLAIEQISRRDLGALSDERLRQYVTVLEQQSRRLDQELRALVEPFAATVKGRRPRTLTPHAVDLALNADIGELTATLRGLERDLARFRDIRELKRSLQDYRVARDDEEFMEFEPARRRRRRGR